MGKIPEGRNGAQDFAAPPDGLDKEGNDRRLRACSDLIGSDRRSKCCLYALFDPKSASHFSESAFGAGSGHRGLTSS
ncbi:hypothetical protein [Asticcacaulis benevestitus]|uniref:hypothetical protein n=1 Tax=Asticcacaulis benevestitus TaxID=347481 RepID=UPI0003A6B567|nr:hypothetical protein [Asticcacaulis benevestitus]